MRSRITVVRLHIYIYICMYKTWQQCVYKPELQLDGDFIAHDLFIVHIIYRDSTEIPYLLSFMTVAFSAGVIAGRCLQTVFAIGKSSFSDV